MSFSAMPSDYQTAPDENEFEKQDSVEPQNKARSRNAAPKLSVIIKGKDRNFRSWSETADATSLSSNGAGFFLSKECQVGGLVSLIMAMPEHHRKYDHDKRLYRIWGLVQYCYEAGGDNASGFHVGVALIGRDAPDSYLKNPTQSYRVAGMDRHGLWKIEELETSFKQRTSTRYWNSIEASLYQLDEEEHTIAAEKTITENISETGASVFSDLRIAVGDRVKFKTSSPAFSSLAVVRRRRIGIDDRTRLHLQFIENTFPVLDIEAPIEEDGEH
jgi:PilZ domain